MNGPALNPHRLNPILIGVVREQIAMALFWRCRVHQERAHGNATQADHCLIRYHAWRTAAKIAAQPLRTTAR